MLAGFIWAKYIGGKIVIQEDIDNKKEFENGLDLDAVVMSEKYGDLPSTFKSFSPILIPIV